MNTRKNLLSKAKILLTGKEGCKNIILLPSIPIDPYARLTDILALKCVNSGNYGFGSIFASTDGKLAAMGT